MESANFIKINHAFWSHGQKNMDFGHVGWIITGKYYKDIVIIGSYMLLVLTE